MLVIRPSQLSVFEQGSRRQLALGVLAELRTSAPHAVAALSPSELEFRLDTAIAKAAVHELDNSADVKTFIRLSLVTGPLFDDYPPFKDIFSRYDNDTRILALFAHATADDWHKASQFDIVSRYRKAPAGIETISLTALGEGHADVYYRYALHPDVWRLGRMTPMTGAADALKMLRDLNCVLKSGYAIVDQQGHFRGAIVAHHNKTDTSIAYWIARPLWGQGIASRALMQLKSVLQTEKITLTIEPGNIPSRKVAAKCGFRQTGSNTFAA